METFTCLKAFVDNPHFQTQKQRSLLDLSDDMIDRPIVDLVNGLNKLPYCFTLQSCYGHFVCDGQNDIHNLAPLSPKEATEKIEYRIAYVAFCIENSPLGKDLFESLNVVTQIDPENIQFCCADWFWERQVNSYALQVEPDRFKQKDTAMVGFKEALHIETVRDKFFARLYKLLENEIKD